MNLENNDKLDIANKVFLGEAQIKDSTQIDVGDDSNKITKVLTLSAKPFIESIKTSSNEIDIEGVVDYDLLVVKEDNEIYPLTQKGKFSFSFKDEKINENSVIVINTTLSNLSNSSPVMDNFSCSCELNFSIYLVEQNSNIGCVAVPEDVFTRETEITYTNLVSNVKYDGVVNFELPKDSKINKILFINNSASIKSVIPSTDYFVVSGEVFSSIIYQTEEGLIKSVVKENSFSEEIEAKGCSKESNIQAKICTKEATSTENVEKKMFVFDIPILILAQVYNKNSFNCVIDAYSLTNEVNLTTTSFVEGDFYSTKQSSENILTSFILDNSLSAIEKILAVTPINIVILNQIVKNNEIVLEGIININVIYYSEDEEGNNVLNSLDIEVPYSLNIKAPDVLENDQVISNIVLADVNVKVKHGKELEILAETKVNYNQTRETISAITTGITLGDEKPKKEHCLEIYLAKSKQTLWDIAKELNISTADLVEQNGDISLPLLDNEKIVAYFRNKLDKE